MKSKDEFVSLLFGLILFGLTLLGWNLKDGYVCILFGGLTIFYIVIDTKFRYEARKAKLKKFPGRGYSVRG